MLKMMEAFSNANEYWAVDLRVKASNLWSEVRSAHETQGLRIGRLRDGQKSGRANVPGKGYLDVLLINGKAQIQQLELAIIPIKDISSGGAVLAGAPHILSQAVQSSAFFSITFGVVSISVPDVSLERSDPVDLVGGLERHGGHRGLRHGRSGCRWAEGWNTPKIGEVRK